MGIFKKPKIPPPPPPAPTPQRASASDTLLSSTTTTIQPSVGAGPSIIAKALSSKSSAQRKRTLGVG